MRDSYRDEIEALRRFLAMLLAALLLVGCVAVRHVGVIHALEGEPTEEQLEESSEESVEEAAEEPVEEALEEPVEETIEEAKEESAEEPAEAGETQIERTDKTDEESDEKTDEKADEKADEKIDEETNEKADEETDEKTDDETDEKADEETDEKADEETGEDEELFCVVRFDANGGSEVAEQRVKRGETAAQPEDPTREGHRFDGWFTEDAALYDFETPVTEDLELLAGWTQEDKEPEEDPYTLYPGTERQLTVALTEDAPEGAVLTVAEPDEARQEDYAAALAEAVETGYTYEEILSVDIDVQGEDGPLDVPVTLRVSAPALNTVWEALEEDASLLERFVLFHIKETDEGLRAERVSFSFAHTDADEESETEAETAIVFQEKEFSPFVLVSVTPRRRMLLGASPAVPYLDASGATQSCTEYSVVTDTSTTLTDGWWVVSADTTISGRVNVSGDVHLILCDNTTLTTTSGGISVNAPSSLTIYAQSLGDGAGLLNAKAAARYNAGIGADTGCDAGPITINGGIISATNDYGDQGGGAGLGGGAAYNGNGGKITSITINNGAVTANGCRDSMAIGGEHSPDGSITINGGTVNAIGDNWAVGIGAHDGCIGHITINGGDVTATASQVFSHGNTAIGAWTRYTGDLGEIVITGGTVTATAGAASSVKGSAIFGSTVIISGGVVTANSASSVGIQTTDGGTINITGGTVNASGTQGMQGANINLSWTAGSYFDTSIKANSYNGSVNFVKPYVLQDTGEEATTSNIAGNVIVPGDDLGNVPYLDASGATQTCASGNYTLLSKAGSTLTSGWYVVDGSQPLSSRITISGDVHLILVDGTTLTASQGIRVTGTNSLTIYAQSTGGSMGALSATGASSSAGIGGNWNEIGGTVTINGGTVTATGGEYGAGIGGGNRGSGGTTTINGGTVNATGGYGGAGIGGGGYTSVGGTTTINGGTVTATGGNGSAGIGGAHGAGGGTTTINGGTVTATGGSGSASGAGIGGGIFGGGGTTTITGGTVTAMGGRLSAGIGGGDSGSGGEITITGGTVNATTSSASGIGNGFSGSGCTVNLSWTAESFSTTSIKASSYGGTVTFEKPYILQGTGTEATTANIAGKTIVPGYPAVPYLDASGATQTCTEYTPLSVALAAGDSLAPGWYVVDTDITHANRITCGDGVHLILKNGTTLTASKGIRVAADINLSIYAQSTDTDTMGRLEAKGEDWFSAGIGGRHDSGYGNITINGGKLTANPGGAGAGIGPGYGSRGNGSITINGGEITATGGGNIDAAIGGRDGNVTINGGSVTATGRSGPGIYNCGGSLTITGGVVTATGSNNDAGIGGYSGESGGTVLITGGTVTATASGSGGAGIGGGYGSAGGTITITGGTVTATGGSSAAGIGGGHNGAGGTITITGGTVNATGGYDGPGLGTDGSGGEITITGGTVTATGGINGGAGIGASGGTLTLDWSDTSSPDNGLPQITASSYKVTTINYTDADRFFGKQGEPETVYYTASEIAALTNTTIVPAAKPPVPYLDYMHTVQSCTDYTPVSAALEGGNLTLGTEGETTWYVVDTDLTTSGRITCLGDVHLILKNGTTLDATHGGIAVYGNNSLTVYQQPGATEETVGRLNATATDGSAGIGSNNSDDTTQQTCGTITINGGKIEATGSIVENEYGGYNGGAGLGETNQRSYGEYHGSLTINGGSVTAYGSLKAFDSGGYGYTMDGIEGFRTININDGSLTASGGSNGINVSKALTVTGGTVYAGYSERFENSMGIWADGYNSDCTIDIRGGLVYLVSTHCGLSLTRGVTCTVSGGTLNASMTGEPTGGTTCGIDVYSGSLIITDGEVETDGLTIMTDSYDNATGTVAVSGGRLTVNETDLFGEKMAVSVEGDFTVTGDGTATVNGDFRLAEKHDDDSTSTAGTLTVSGGWVNVTGDLTDGGAATVNGGDLWVGGSIDGAGTLTLDWSDTSSPDNGLPEITASSYKVSSVSYTNAERPFKKTGTNAALTTAQIKGLTNETIVPGGVFEVPYLDYVGGSLVQEICTEYTPLSAALEGGNLTLGADDGNEHWYVVDTDLTASGRISCVGDVHLILKNGTTLDATHGGIAVNSGNSLTIYQQPVGDGETMGALNATAADNQAGIGGDHNKSSGTITINGGTINASAWPTSGYGGGAGIGAGNNSAGNGTVIINNGAVTAKGTGGGAGIGGAGARDNGSSSGGTITINGGTVNATGNAGGAGIGGGWRSAGGNITITGGYITAYGRGGAGIGGGDGGSGGATTINGGVVVADGGTYGGGVGIGAGKTNGGGSVTITGGTVTATGASDRGGIGGNVDLTLDWSDTSDSSNGLPQITASSYKVSSVSYTNAERPFKKTGTNAALTTDEIAALTNETIVPGGYLPVPYLDYVGGALVEKSCTEYTLLSEALADSYTIGADDGGEHWYVVDQTTLNAAQRITCVGDVHLILKNGTTLDATHGGIAVNDPNSLTVYQQPEESGKAVGVLNANSTDEVPGNAAIGGDNQQSAGSITIAGGTVNATGSDGSETTSATGAAIGGGYRGAGGTVTICGGTVHAQAYADAAGIGGGCQGAVGTITINSGTVEASSTATHGGDYAGGAGIGGGGGEPKNGGSITITGGTVTASGCGSGAGIGGGGSVTNWGGSVDSITITGGTVTATGNGNGAAIGGGSSTRYGNASSGGTITITGGVVSATGGKGIGGGGNSGSADIHLGWTSATYPATVTSVTASGYKGTVTFDKPYVLQDSGALAEWTSASDNNITGVTIIPGVSFAQDVTLKQGRLYRPFSDGSVSVSVPVNAAWTAQLDAARLVELAAWGDVSLTALRAGFDVALPSGTLVTLAVVGESGTSYYAKRLDSAAAGIAFGELGAMAGGAAFAPSAADRSYLFGVDFGAASAAAGDWGGVSFTADFTDVSGTAQRGNTICAANRFSLTALGTLTADGAVVSVTASPAGDTRYVGEKVYLVGSFTDSGLQYTAASYGTIPGVWISDNIVAFELGDYGGNVNGSGAVSLRYPAAGSYAVTWRLCVGSSAANIREDVVSNAVSTALTLTDVSPTLTAERAGRRLIEGVDTLSFTVAANRDYTVALEKQATLASFSPVPGSEQSKTASVTAVNVPVPTEAGTYRVVFSMDGVSKNDNVYYTFIVA